MPDCGDRHVADRYIDVLGREVEIPIGHHDVDAQVGKHGAERREPRHQPVGRKRGRAGHRQPLSGRAAPLPGQRLRHRAKGRVDRKRQSLSSGGEGDIAVIADEKFLAEVQFEFGDLPADGDAGEPHFLRRSRKVIETGSCFESDQILEEGKIFSVTCHVSQVIEL